MASQTVKGTGSTVNDGGTVVNGGNVGGDGDTAKFTKNLALTDVNGTGPKTGSVVVAKSGGSATAPAPTLETNPDGIKGALDGGTLAYFPSATDRNFIVRGAGSTAAGKINNSATNGARLTSPAGDMSDHGRVPVSIISTMSHGVRDIKVTALPNNDRHPEMTLTGGGAPSTFSNPADGTAAVRSEIDPSRAVPGELTYMFGGKNPKSDDYKSKEAAES